MAIPRYSACRHRRNSGLNPSTYLRWLISWFAWFRIENMLDMINWLVCPVLRICRMKWVGLRVSHWRSLQPLVSLRRAANTCKKIQKKHSCTYITIVLDFSKFVIGHAEYTDGWWLDLENECSHAIHSTEEVPGVLFVYSGLYLGF